MMYLIDDSYVLLRLFHNVVLDNLRSASTIRRSKFDSNKLAANGFVTMDISSEDVNVEYYARDMKFEEDLYPVACDLQPSYTFQITQKS